MATIRPYWETPEGLAKAKQATLDFADMETEADIKTQMGPIGSQAVDMKRTKAIMGSDWGSPGSRLRGLYIPEGAQNEAGNQKWLGPMFTAEDVTMSGDTVYTIGTDSANIPILAHEFRHRSKDQKGERQTAMTHLYNYRLSLHRADTPAEWDEAAKRYVEFAKSMGMIGDSERSDDELARGALDSWEYDFIRHEAQALSDEGDNPKKRKWFGFIKYESHIKDLTEQSERRKQARGH